MRRAALGLILAGTLAGMTGAWGQGTVRLWYRGSFDGEVVVRDGQTPGYYYHPSPSRYPTFAERYDQPVICPVCGHYHRLGEVCPWCGAQPSRQDRQEAAQDAVYSPYPIPGQYWNDPQPHFRFRAPIRVGWPYVRYDQPWD